MLVAVFIFDVAGNGLSKCGGIRRRGDLQQLVVEKGRVSGLDLSLGLMIVGEMSGFKCSPTSFKRLSNLQKCPSHQLLCVYCSFFF